MKTPENYVHRPAKVYVQNGCIFLIIATGLIIMQNVAWARGGRIAAAGGARIRFNNANDDGYWYGPTPTSSQSNGAGGAASSLPSGYLAKLPDGAVPMVIFGKQYYWANGNDYSAVMYGGRTVYVIANP